MSKTRPRPRFLLVDRSDEIKGPGVHSVPDLPQPFRSQDLEMRSSPPAELARQAEQEFRNWGKLIDTARIRLD